MCFQGFSFCFWKSQTVSVHKKCKKDAVYFCSVFVLIWKWPKDLRVLATMVETKETNTGFKFDLKATNGEVIAVSEGYKAKENCANGIESVKKNAPEAEVVEQEAVHSKRAAIEAALFIGP